jgi:two-component system chemotaxis response regulator CheY
MPGGARVVVPVMKSVLLVDDSKAMRMIVRRTLRQAGYSELKVTEAENGVDALSKFSEAAPDLILCDWNMPEMTGIELLQELRGRGAQVSFGFVTSEATVEMREKASNARAQFLIAKPFTPDQFRTILKDYLG